MSCSVSSLRRWSDFSSCFSICKNLVLGFSMRWWVGSFALVESVPVGCKSLRSAAVTLRRCPEAVPFGAVCSRIQFSRCKKSGTRAILPSLVRHNSKFSPISQEEKLKDQRHAASSSIVTRWGVRLQNLLAVSICGYPPYISV